MDKKRRRCGQFVSKRRSLSLEGIKFFAKESDDSDGDECEEDSRTSTPSSSTDQPVSDCSWRDGRRIVELGHLAKQLKCVDCGNRLHLDGITKETRYGYGSLLYIDCDCGMSNTVETGKRHRVNRKGPKVFDVNTKAALGMLHSGSGTRQIESFMAVIEVPGLNPSSMKDRENELAEHIADVAHGSCTQALIEEVQLTSGTDGQDLNQVPSGVFKYDMGWQKRGSGRCYDSKSGVGTLFGNKTGKIVAYDVRSKDCRKCSYHLNQGKDPPTHSCSKNWSGSSKGMEPDVGCSLVKEIESKNVCVGVMVMDDDATTMAKIKVAVPHPITKWSDLNHAKKHLGNSLYSLQKKHKVLTTKLIQHFQKCFSYAVCQNKNKPDSLACALQQIVPHLFGDHGNCGAWCSFKNDTEHYRQSSTAYGRDLSGEDLRKDLDNVFNKLVLNADKLAPCASTKEVESFNNMLAAKAPKRCHYSASGSLKNRLNCTVAQKNAGCSYINDVNVETGLSPGKFYGKLAMKRDNRRVKRLKYENSKDFKKKRIEKKLNNRYSSAQKELREGPSYQSGVALSTLCDITEIPAAVSRPTHCQLDEEDLSAKVFCDIETTSLQRTCDIVQLAAVCGDDNFNCYILPSQAMSQAASQVTGLTVMDNKMFCYGKHVVSECLHHALVLFLSWLQCRGKCVLIGHNFFKFDLPRLIRAFEICNLLNALQDVVVGSIDTLPLYKSMYPDLNCHKQEFLVSKFADVQYSAHNAIADVQSLQLLVNVTSINANTFVEHSELLSTSINLYRFDKESDCNKSTLECLISDNVVSKDMVRKMSNSGLCLQYLQLAVNRNGLDGLMQLFKEKSAEGKPRVTSSKRIIEGVFHYIEKKK